MDLDPIHLSSALRILELAGVFVFAASGALAAGRKSLDLFGVLVIATVTAIGGGTVRDVLLHRDPIFWVAEPIYLLVIWIGALCTVLYTRARRAPNKSILVVDAIGLSFFAIAGAQIAEARGMDGVIVVLMGTITGSVGGMLRDLLLREIPLVMRRGNLYASAAILGICLYLLLQAIGIPRDLAAVGGMLGIGALRFAGITWGLTLPVYRLQWEEEVRRIEEEEERSPPPRSQE